MTAIAPATFPHDFAEPPVTTTLANLIRVLSQLTDDEDEIVGTLLHMVERRSVRLVAPGGATAA